MRSLFLLRGAPAAGKSTWIKENKLEPYTISTDGLRLMYQSPITTIDGELAISQNHDKEVWDLLLSLAEARMKNGELLIIDATHYKAPLLNRYKEFVKKYRYRVYVVDFTGISLEELISRNSARGFRKVPEEVIKKMYVALADNSEVKKAYNIITPEEASKIINSPLEPLKITQEKIVIFGDIHGCYTPLKEYFDKNPFSEDTCYIFTGDYLDRGIENKEVLEFLLSIYKKENVVLLEGNHEKWLRIYSQKEYEIPTDNIDKEYKDIFITRIISQLKNKAAIIQKKINKNTTKAEEVYRLANDKKEIYYEFELIDVAKTRKTLFLENEELQRKLSKINKYINVLQHEEHNTKEYINHVIEQYNELFNENISMNIVPILEKDYPVQRIKTDNPIKSTEFLSNTYKQIKDIDKAEIRQLCQKFAQMSYFVFHGTRYVVTHGGLPCVPTLKISANEMIHGVGKYEDVKTIDKIFATSNYTPLNFVQVHGHRNIMNDPVEQFYGRIYNLEQKVEFGGNLAILEITYNNTIEHKVIEIPNTVFTPIKEEVKEEKPDLDIIKELYHSRLVQTKYLKEDILSFNFTRDAFYESQWNELTCTARGLFVDKTNGNIVARSYNKFFNYKEVDKTKPEDLKKNLKFPLIGYKKENGFLGLVSKYNGKIHFFTKSTNEGTYVNWFIGALCNTFGIYFAMTPNDLRPYTYIYNGSSKNEDIQSNICNANMLEFLKSKLIEQLNPFIEEGYTYIFECVDPDNDPHIIKYPTADVYLLDVVKNNLKNEFKPYNELLEIGKNLQVNVKSKELEFNTWEEFEKWKDEFRHGITQWDCSHEGYVFEDTNGFRIKFKSSFYTFWKQMRHIKENIQSGRGNKKVYKTKEEIEVVKLLENIPKEELKDMSIIDIQTLFYKED